MSKPRRGASLVAAGIMLSRLAGFFRDRLIGRYLGLTAVADAFGAALRIPNFLQNLFGEGGTFGVIHPCIRQSSGAG